MAKKKKHKFSIRNAIKWVSGVAVATILAGLLNEVLHGVYAAIIEAFANTSASLCVKLVNIYYIMAARYTPTDLPFATSFTIFYIIIVLCAFCFRLIKICDSNCEEFPSKSQNKCKNRKYGAKDPFKSLRSRMVWLKIAFFVMLPFLLFMMSSIAFAHIRYKKFHRKLTSIRPAISEVEFYRLQSRWVRMKCKGDYESLVDCVDAYEKLPIEHEISD